MRIDDFNSRNEYLNGRLEPGHDATSDLRRPGSGYHSSASDPGTQNGTLKKSDELKKLKTELKNVKPRVDTGLGVKKSVSGTRLPDTLSSSAGNRASNGGGCGASEAQIHQKRSEPIIPKHRKYSGTFKVPDLPTSTFNRNLSNRRSLTRLFSKEKKGDKAGGEIRTPFGTCQEATEEDNAKRSNFLSKRSLTSLSLFSKKDEDIPPEPKERKNSISRLRAARSSLDLSSLGFGSISRASSKITLAELKEEGTEKVPAKSSDRPWFDLTRVWKDQNKELPGEEMLQKMRRDRSGRARTVPSGLGGSVENTPDPDLPASCGVTPPAAASCVTPSTLKKTLHVLSPEVLTNWYEKRKRVENLYGPRRNSVSNLIFHPDKKQSSPLVELKNGDKMRKSMLNLEELRLGDINEVCGKGVQRSESAKLSSERTRWRGKGIQRSESARLINMQQSPLQHRQNSHPNLVHQQSYSSSSSSLADRSSLESPSKLTTCSLSTTDPYFTEAAPNSDSDLEAEADPPDWRHSLAEEVLNRLSAKELKRQDVINELFHTEKSHVRNLKVLDTVFRQPLVDKGRISRELSNRLFANLPEVLALHQKYNTAMKTRIKSGFPIGDISDILRDMFLEGNSDQFVKVCGEFIKKQNMTIEELKRVRTRDAKLEMLLTELERKPACRRLQLQSMLPMEHQRLVKYPLLLEQIAKYSDSSESRQEHDLVLAAMEKTKEILDSIDRLVAEEQNRERLNEIQSNLDSSGLDKMGSDHPIYKEYKNLDLTKHLLMFDGILNLKLGDTKRVKQLHVVLLEDCLMLLQKQGDKYLLKFHNNQSQTGSDSRRAFHSPIIKYSTMLVRPVATDRRAFYLLNTTECGPQIYELLANSTTERSKWIKHISEVANAHKSRDGMPAKTKSEPEQLGSSLQQDKKEKPDLRSQSFREPTGSPRLTRSDRQNSSPPECPLTSPDSGEGRTDTGSADPGSSDSGASTPSAPKKRLQRVEILKIVDSEPMIEPSQVRVNEAIVLVADPVITPFEKLRQKDKEVHRILDEKQKLIAQILQIPEDEYDVIRDIAETSTHKREVREVLLLALAQARSLTQVVSSSLQVTEEDLVSRSSPCRDLGHGSTGDQLVQITASMNQHLTDLLAILQEREEERDLLRRELAKYQDQIRGYLRSDSSRSFPSPLPNSMFSPLPSSVPSPLPNSRPHSFISNESDPMDLESDPRPHSLISLESDTPDCPHSDEDELSPGEQVLEPHRPAPDSDLTPTEERVLNPDLPGPDSDLPDPHPDLPDPDHFVAEQGAGSAQDPPSLIFQGKPWDLNEKIKESSKEWTPTQEET